MRLRNKKTGKVWGIPKDRWPTVQQDDISFFAAYGSEGHLFSYKTLAELNEEWEDYKPKEPLIKKESQRGVLRAAARMSGTDTAHVRKSDYAEVVIFEFKGKELCSVELRGKGINTAHDGWYTIDQLCGEEEG